MPIAMSENACLNEVGSDPFEAVKAISTAAVLTLVTRGMADTPGTVLSSPHLSMSTIGGLENPAGRGTDAMRMYSFPPEKIMSSYE